MTKKTRILLVTAAVLTVLTLCTLAVLADDTANKGSDLPVSESYVLRALRALDDKLTAKIDALSGEVANLKETAGTKPSDTGSASNETPVIPTDTEPQSAAPASVSFEVVHLTKGQKLLGACEMILRSGTANTVCPGADMIADLTVGCDLPGNTAAEKNHLLLVPRDDGRGLIVTSSEAYLMVRGAYQVES